MAVQRPVAYGSHGTSCCTARGVQVRLDMPAFAEPVTALMVSVADGGRLGLNALHLRQALEIGSSIGSF